MQRSRLLSLALSSSICASLLLSQATTAANGLLPADARGAVEQRAYDPPRNSWYGPSRQSRDAPSQTWAIGTFHGQNGANGTEETITIRPDGSAEVRTRDEPPRYGTFAGETLTIESRISKVQPARGGIVIDGAYYRR